MDRQAFDRIIQTGGFVSVNTKGAVDAKGFGNCTNYYECEAACPKEISAGFIARMNRDYLWATAKDAGEKGNGGGH